MKPSSKGAGFPVPSAVVLGLCLLWMSLGVAAGWQPTGLNTGQVKWVLDVPGDPHRIYVSDNGTVKRSEDGGQTWSPLTDGLPPGFTAVCGILAEVRGKQGEYAVVAGGNDGVYILFPQADSWAQLGSGLPVNPWVSSLAYHPDNPYGPYVYATLSDSVHYVSIYGGTWTQTAPLATGPDHAFPYSSWVVVTQQKSAGFFATIFAGTSGKGLLASLDNGLSWIGTALTEGLAGWVNTLTGDPYNPFLYAGNGDAYSANQQWGYTSSDLFGTAHNPFSGWLTNPISALFVNPWPMGPLKGAGREEEAPPSPVYMGTEGGEVWRSMDAGVTWTEIGAGLPGNVILSLGGTYPDLYAGTQGAGLWAFQECSVTCSAEASFTSGPAPLTVQFGGTATADHCAEPVTHHWDFGDGATSTDEDPAHTYLNPGLYTWTYTAASGGFTCSFSFTVDVLPGQTLLLGEVGILRGETLYPLDGPGVAGSVQLYDEQGGFLTEVPIVDGRYAIAGLPSKTPLPDGIYKARMRVSFGDNVGLPPGPRPPGGEGRSEGVILKQMVSPLETVEVQGFTRHDLTLPPPIVFVHEAGDDYTKWYSDDPEDPDHDNYWDNRARSEGFITYTPTYSWTAGTCWPEIADQLAEQILLNMADLTSGAKGAAGAELGSPMVPIVIVAHGSGGSPTRIIASQATSTDIPKMYIAKVYPLGTPHSGSPALLGGGGPALGTDATVGRFNESFPDYGGVNTFAYAGSRGWWGSMDSDGPVHLQSAFNITRLSRGVAGKETTLVFPYFSLMLESEPGHIFPFSHDELGSPPSVEDILVNGILHDLRPGDKSAARRPPCPVSPAGAVTWGTVGRTSKSVGGSTSSRSGESTLTFPFEVSETDGIAALVHVSRGSADFSLMDPMGGSLPFEEGIRVTDPAAGEWSLLVETGPEGVTFQGTTLENSHFGAEAYMLEPYYLPGQAAVVRAVPDGDWGGVTLESASAKLFDTQGNELESIPLYDDGMGYAGDFTAPMDPGAYPVETELGGTYRGTSFRRVGQTTLAVFPDLDLFTGSPVVQPVDTDGDALFDTLRLDIPVDVPEAGCYVVKGDLYDDEYDFFISSASAGFTVAAPGIHAPTLLFPVEMANCSLFEYEFKVRDLTVLDGAGLYPLDFYDGPSILAGPYDPVNFSCQPGDPGPTVSSVWRDEGVQGQSYTVRIGGTNFEGGASVDFGTGIQVAKAPARVDSNLILASIAVDAQAAPGPRDVTVTNPSGDSGTRVGGFVVKDDQKPTVIFQTPTEGTEVSETVAVSVAVTDDLGIDHVEFFLDDLKAPVAVVAQFPFRFDWDTTEVSDGPHSISATAYDTGGQTGQATVAVTVNNLKVPGDCDGSGTVTIGEVQRAINMFLGIEPPSCNVDCDSSGTVSIGEVQRVINAFLGISNTC